MNIALLVNQIEDPIVRDNFKKIMDFLNQQELGASAFKAVELYVTANATGIKIKHGLNSVPKDAILTMMVSPSGARLVVGYSDFTNEEVSFDVTGLSSGETLHARLLVGTFQSVVTFGESFVTEDSNQQLRSKF